MANRRRTGKNSKKVLMMIVGIVVLIVAVAVGIIMSKGKAIESNEDIDIKEPTKAVIEQKLEYGDDIENKTFTVHTEDGTQEANFVDLDPEVDTMKVGGTEHLLELEDEMFVVTVVVEDTNKPVLKGVKDVIELEGEEVDLEEELKKLITAEDPVDGELEVTLEINEKEEENKYDVIATATDKNENKTIEKFEVVVKVIEKEEAKEETADKKAEENNSSSVAAKPKQEKPKQEKPKQESEPKQESKPKQEKPKQESKPKQEKPKQEEPKQEKPKQEKPKQEEPKQEKQPEPEVEFNMPPLKNPSGLPSGATLSQELTPGFHIYSYSRSLPGGGSIERVDVSSDFGGSATMTGTDNDGNSFISRYAISHGKLEHQMVRPTFTQDDISILFEVGRAFTRAYGLQ